MRYLVFILSFLFVYCNSNSKDYKIILTNGIGMNPDSPRFGLSITPDAIYYCEEDAVKMGNYTYYKCVVDSRIFDQFKNKIEMEFFTELPFTAIIDATPFQLNTKFEASQKVHKFYFRTLNKKQLQIINDILQLKRLRFQRIDYYEFPMDLLAEKLPEPPSIETR